MKISEYRPENALMCLFKGKPKRGKKTAWASFPEPIYALDTDLRMATVANHPVLSQRQIEFDQFVDYEAVYYRLKELRENCEFRTVVLHSLTSLARMTQEYIFASRGVTTGAAKRKSADSISRIGVINLMDISDYSGESGGLSMIAQSLRAIHMKHKCNIVLVAHTIAGEDRLITGGNKIGAEIPSYFNEVYHFDIDTGILDNESAKYICQIAPTTNFSGTSFYGMPDKIEWTNKLFYDEISKYFPQRKDE